MGILNLLSQFRHFFNHGVDPDRKSCREASCTSCRSCCRCSSSGSGCKEGRQEIGRQTQQELNQLRQSMSGLKAAGTNFFGARQAVQSWKENMEMGDDKIFVPMTNSLLVPGKMAEGAMLVELGGGIMMEKSIEDTIKFMDRRMQMVTSSMNKCG